MKKTKILRNTFVSVGMFFALGRLLFAGTTDSVLNFSKYALGIPQPPIITFDAPGAGTGPGQGTQGLAINPGGVIAGDYVDASNVFHGILRGFDTGTITPFDAPGAGTEPYQGTVASSINSAGVIAGLYVDQGVVFHGFVRASDGTFTTFDVLGAGTGPGQGTIVTAVDGLNEAGATVGYYFDSNNVAHGFVRDTSGTITTFNVTG